MLKTTVLYVWMEGCWEAPGTPRATLELLDSPREWRTLVSEIKRGKIKKDELYSLPVSDLNFGARAHKCCIRLSISTIGDLVKHTCDDLLEVRGFGCSSLWEVEDRLAELGLKLRDC